MNYVDIPLKEINTSQLIDRLAQGWCATHAGLALELVQRWAAKFLISTDVREIKENTLSCTAEHADIRLRTMDEVPYLLISGEEDLYTRLHAFWNKYSSPFHLPFILALSDAAHAAAQAHFTNDRCLILSVQQIKQLLRSASPMSSLRQFLLQQIPKRTLIPYNILVPADGVTFFGRENELNRLTEEDSISFAIAGPGRIGKTSLVKRYRKVKLQRRSARASNLIYVSFYQSDTTSDGAARFLAMQIESSRRSSRVTAGQLVNFLKYRNKVYGGPLDLILDEVDEVCRSETFKFLGEAARLGYCRLILCGRGTLMRCMLSGNSPTEGRLAPIQLEPLHEEAARALLVKPLTDLGFEIEEPERLLEEVLELSGSLPHHIQIFGMKLAEQAIASRSNKITVELMERVKGDLIVAQFFIKTLDEINDPKTRLVGLALLDGESRSFTIPYVQEIAKREGLIMTSRQVNDICLDLTINNVLMWDKASFKIANGGLPLYTKQTGYLSSALDEARRAFVS